MQTILTKYHGATNCRGSRISATTSGGAGRLALGWDHGIDSEDNHGAAARALMEKMSWSGKMIGGHTKNGDMVWVFAKSSSPSVKRKATT